MHLHCFANVTTDARRETSYARIMGNHERCTGQARMAQSKCGHGVLACTKARAACDKLQYFTQAWASNNVLQHLSLGAPVRLPANSRINAHGHYYTGCMRQAPVSLSCMDC